MFACYLVSGRCTCWRGNCVHSVPSLLQVIVNIDTWTAVEACGAWINSLMSYGLRYLRKNACECRCWKVWPTVLVRETPMGAFILKFHILQGSASADCTKLASSFQLGIFALAAPTAAKVSLGISVADSTLRLKRLLQCSRVTSSETRHISGGESQSADNDIGNR